MFKKCAAIVAAGVMILSGSICLACHGNGGQYCYGQSDKYDCSAYCYGCNDGNYDNNCPRYGCNTPQYERSEKNN